METVALVIALILVGLQTFATVHVRRSVSYAADQKRAQLKLIWLLPLLGAAMVLSVMHQDGDLVLRRGGSSQGPRDRG